MSLERRLLLIQILIRDQNPIVLLLLESKNYQPLGQAATVEINTKDYKQTADEFINEFDRLKRIALSKNENTKN